MRIGLFDLGEQARQLPPVLLQKHNISLCWVIRKSKILEHRSVRSSWVLRQRIPDTFSPRMNGHRKGFSMNIPWML